MPEGTGVGSVYLDFVVRNTVAQQIRDITSQAAAQAQPSAQFFLGFLKTKIHFRAN